MRRALAFAAALALGAASCDRPREHAEAVEHRALGGRVAARVGSVDLPVELVVSVATAQGLAPDEALRRLIDDAVSASGASARGLDRSSPASWQLTTARARFLSSRLLTEARAAGPPTDDEIRRISDEHWVEVDRPPSVRVVHALALRPKAADEALLQRARVVASALREALVSASSPDDFKARAKAFPAAEGVEVRVEDLPPMTADGWVTEGGGKMDEVFSAAAHRIVAVGDTSAVVETPFGWHVIRLVERIPERRMPMETRRVAFAEEAYGLRVRAARDAIIEARGKATPVAVDPAAEQRMRSLHELSAHRATPQATP